MKNTGQRTQWRSTNAIPKTFTLSSKHIEHLLHRKATGALSLSHVIRELIDADMQVNGEGCDHENK